MCRTQLLIIFLFINSLFAVEGACANQNIPQEHEINGLAADFSAQESIVDEEQYFDSNPVILTPSERQYLKSHPEIVLGSGISFEPFTIQNSNGEITGFDVDIANLISKRTGLKIRFELGKWAEIVDKGINREIDGLSTSSPKKRGEYFNFSRPYFRSTTIVIVKKGNPGKILKIEDTEGKRLAVQKGNVLFDDVSYKFGSNLIIDEYESQYDLIEALAKDKADFLVIDDTAFYIAKRVGLRSFIEAAFPVGDPFDIVFSIRKDRPEFLSIINKGLASITELEKNQIRNRWFEEDNPNFTNNKALLLLPEEKNYLDVKSIISVCGHAKQLPYQHIDAHGKLTGFAFNYQKIFARRLNVGMRMKKISDNTRLLDALERGECDAVIMADNQQIDSDITNQTTSFLSFPYVIATTYDKPAFNDLQQIEQEKLAVLSGSAISEILKVRYPQMQFHEVNSLLEGMEIVRSGDSYGLIDSSASISYAIQVERMSQIKIAGDLPIKLEFSVATPKHIPVLGRIFQKAVGSLTEHDQKEILNHWLAVKYEQSVNYRLVWEIVFIALLPIIMFGYWNLRLRNERERVEMALKSERKAIQENINFIDMIAHEYRTPLSVMTSSLDLLEKKLEIGSHEGLDKYISKIRKSSDRLKHIFDISLDEKRINDASIILDKNEIDLVEVVKASIEYSRQIYSQHTIHYQPLISGNLLLTGDEELLMTVMANLLDNACKYSDSTDVVTVYLENKSGVANVRIEDHGIGIKEGEKEKIFDKFYRSPRAGKNKGAGVGLYLVKKILDLHQGTISYYTVPDEGTKVTFTLPLSPGVVCEE